MEYTPGSPGQRIPVHGGSPSRSDFAVPSGGTQDRHLDRLRPQPFEDVSKLGCLISKSEGQPAARADPPMRQSTGLFRPNQVLGCSCKLTHNLPSVSLYTAVSPSWRGGVDAPRRGGHRGSRQKGMQFTMEDMAELQLRRTALLELLRPVGRWFPSQEPRGEGFRLHTRRTCRQPAPS